MSISDYQTAAEYLGSKRDRPLPGRATRLQRRSDSTIAVRYQATDVVTYHADGSAVLQSDGWQTATTKARIVEYTRVRVYSDKGQWFIRMGSGGWDDPTPASLYYDGMRIGADGLPVAPRYPEASDRQRKRDLDRKISEYIKAFAASIVANGLEAPGGGDCWGCLMQVQDRSLRRIGAMRLQGKPTAHGRIEPMGLSHYLDHFSEGYFVPSLLANAIVAAGYRDPGFIWQMIASRRDGEMAARVLRGYFRNMKPALLAEINQ